MKIEIRGKSVLIEGYVNVCERNSRLLPKRMASNAPSDFVERIKEKTFERAIEKNDNVGLMFNHQRYLGSQKEGNLELYEDNIGLYARATVTDEEVIGYAREKRLTGWSFGFSTIADSWDVAEDGTTRRTLEDIELVEVSILTEIPAYFTTSIELRGEDCKTIERRGVEETLEVIEIEEVEKEPEKPIEYTMQEKEIEFLKLGAKI